MVEGAVAITQAAAAAATNLQMEAVAAANHLLVGAGAIDMKRVAAATFADDGAVRKARHLSSDAFSGFTRCAKDRDEHEDDADDHRGEAQEHTRPPPRPSQPPGRAVSVPVSRPRRLAPPEVEVDEKQEQE